MPLITYSPSLNLSNAAINGIDDNTVLMLHAEDLTDSSNYHHSISSTVTLDTINYIIGTSSLKFNSDSFIISNSNDFNFETGDFTIDFWMNQPITGNQYLCGGRSPNEWSIAIANNVISISINTVGWPIATGTTIVTDGSWHHIALVRYGTSFKLYVDGSVDISTTLPSGFNWVYNDFNIGGQEVQNYTGWLDEFRVSKGIARWTSNFTPRLYPYQSVGNGIDSGDILLLHFDSAQTYIDPTLTDSYSVLLLEGETLTDTSTHHQSFTTTAIIDSTNYHRGTASLNFNNSTFSLNSQTDFHFGTNNFTIDFWHRQLDTTLQYQCGGTTSSDWSIGTYGDNIPFLQQFAANNPTTVFLGSTVINDTNWHHVALVRSGTRLILFVDGNLETEAALPSNFNWTQDFTIGGRTVPQFTGWVDDFRVSNGIARWTSNFSILSAITYIDSTTFNHTVNSVGTTTVNYPYGKYVWGINFGNGDGYAAIAPSTDFNFGAYDWTIDFWVNFNTVSNVISSLFCTGADNKGIYFKYTGGASVGQLDLLLGNGTSYTTYTTSFTPIVSTWYHIALTRHSNIYKIFINGMLINTIVSTTRISEGVYRFIVGGEYSNTIAYRMHGYMDEFRISKGVVRYDENFVPWSIPYGGMPVLPPPSLTFTDLTGVELITVYTQSSLVTGLIIPETISISGGNASYSLNGTTFTTNTGTINPNSTVWIRMTSSNTSLSMKTATLTIGSTSFVWNVTTKFTTINGNMLLLVNNATTPYADRSLYGATTTVIGSPTTSHPKFTYNSIDFTSAAALMYSNSLYAVGTGDFTVDYWIYRFATISTSGAFSSGLPNDSTTGFMMMINSNTLSYTIGTNAGGITITSTSLPLNTWTHIAFIRQNGICIAYQDGVPLAIVNSFANIISSQLTIGGRYGNGTGALSGAYMSNIRLLNYADFATFSTANSPTLDGQTILLLKGYGTNLILGSLTDDSGHHTPTTNNITISDALYFNGYSSYISIPDSSDWYFTGDALIETWIYWNGSYTSPMTLWGQNPGSTSNMRVSITSSSGQLTAYTTSDTALFTSTSNLIPNSWNHLAYQKTGTTFTLYLNGNVIGTAAFTSPLLDVADSWYIGGEVGSSPIANPFCGAMKEFRISNISRYPTTISAYSSDANTLLLMHGDTDLGDSSSFNRTFTTFSGSQTISNTIYSIGTGSIQSTGGMSTDASLGSTKLDLQSDFTIECWFRWNTSVTSVSFFSLYYNSGNTGYGFYYYPDGRIIFDYYGSRLSFNLSPTANVWYHFAAVKSGSNGALYMNGVSQSTGTLPTTGFLAMPNGTSMFIGIDAINHGYGGAGFFDEVRISNVARWTSNFSLITPFIPASTFSTDANTLLLMHGNNGTPTSITDEVGNSIHSFGDVEINTATTRFDNNSLYINGTIGGYFTTDSSTNYVLGTNDFTMEFWINISNVSGNYKLISNCNTSTYGTNNWYFSILNNQFVFESYNMITNSFILSSISSNILANTWYHVAIVKQGNTYGLFVNGMLHSKYVTATRIDNSASSNIIFGPKQLTSTTFNMYIDNFRLSNGTVRYPVNFAVPTQDYN